MWRTQRRYNPVTRGSYAWLVRASAFINFFYFYCVDGRLRPVLPQVQHLLPPHRQAVHQRQRVSQTPGHQGRDRLRAAGQRVRRGRGRAPAPTDLRQPRPGTHRGAAAQVARDPAQPVHPGRRDRRLPLRAVGAAGRVLSDPDARPPGLRADLLRTGPPATTSTSPRPEQVGLVFDRRIIRKGRHLTPGRFRTRVITEGVIPSLHVDYKNAKIKQYHKEGRALRTETTINDTRDFGLSKRLTNQNLTALRQIGFTANRRLLGAGRVSQDLIRGAQALHRPHRADRHRRGHPHPRAAFRRRPRPRAAPGPAHPPAATPRIHQP